MTVQGYLGRYGSDIGIVEGEPGALTVRPGPAAVNPNFLAFSPDKQVVYAALRHEGASEVGAFAVEGDGLRPLGAQPSGGDGLCHMSVDASGRYVLSAHFPSGSVAVHPITADGSVGERSDLVQHSGTEPHVHMVVNDPTGQYVLAVEHGDDTVFRYELVDGRLQSAGAASVPVGAGPWHVAFHPSVPYAYVSNQLDSTVSVLNLSTFEIERTLVPFADDSRPAPIRVSPDGRFCYIGNQGSDTIAMLAVSEDGSEVEPETEVPCGGELPRHLALTDSHLYVANRNSNSVAQFAIDPGTGTPLPAAAPVQTPEPMCLLLSDAA